MKSGCFFLLTKNQNAWAININFIVRDWMDFCFIESRLSHRNDSLWIAKLFADIADTNSSKFSEFNRVKLYMRRLINNKV